MFTVLLWIFAVIGVLAIVEHIAVALWIALTDSFNRYQQEEYRHSNDSI